MKFLRSLALTALCAALGCSSDAPPGGGAPDGGGMPDAPGTVLELIRSDFSIPPQSEFYQCQRLTATEDLYITRVTPVAPDGTHHTILATETNSSNPDGVTRCGPFDDAWTMLFASGVSSPPLDMPPGIALEIPKGTQIILNLHLFNATDQTLNGTAGYDVNVVSRDEVDEVANIILAGPVMFNIPAGANDYRVTGTCRVSGDTRFFAVFPHAHQLGKHIKIWTETNAGDTVVHDAPYDFEEQDFTSFALMDLKAGDKIGIECTYDNPNNFAVGFGDSSKQEMCFAISYLSPPVSATFGSICPF